MSDPPTASRKEFPTRVSCSNNKGLMHLHAGEKPRLLSLMSWRVRTCCQLSSYLLYPPKSSSPVLQAYQLFSQFDPYKMVFAPFCFLQHCFLRLSCISSGSPLSIVIAHWFFYNPTCSRVNFDPPRTLDCCHALPSLEKYHFASFCVRYNFPRVFQCFLTTHLMTMPPTGHIWPRRPCRVITSSNPFDSNVSFW